MREISHTVQHLASRAMAILRIKWLFTTQLILNSIAVATSLIQSLEIAIVVFGMDFVRSAELPLIVLVFDFAGFSAFFFGFGFVFFGGHQFGD